MFAKLSLPYLHDHHSHFSLYAGMSKSLSLKGVSDKDKALKLLSKNDNGKLNAAYGWNSGFYYFEKSELNSLPPLIIANLSLHGFVMNDSAAKILRARYPEIVDNYRDSNWCEEHIAELLLFFINVMSATIESMVDFADFLLKKGGVYEIEDMLLPSQELFEAINDSCLKSRISFWADYKTFKTLPIKTQKAIKGVKLFADGANGSLTAAISQPYLNGKRGYLSYTTSRLTEILEECSEISNGVAIHAIGDAALIQTVQAVENIRKIGSDVAVRIEHAQFIDEITAKRAKKAGIILSMQPNFTEDSMIYSDRLPNKFRELNNPFRMLIDKAGFVAGEDLVFGSDGAPHGVEFALKESLFPPYPSQKLSLKEFVKAYCIDEKFGTHTFSVEEIL